MNKNYTAYNQTAHCYLSSIEMLNTHFFDRMFVFHFNKFDSIVCEGLISFKMHTENDCFGHLFFIFSFEFCVCPSDSKTVSVLFISNVSCFGTDKSQILASARDESFFFAFIQSQMNLYDSALSSIFSLV